jgi:hypothetical protein
MSDLQEALATEVAAHLGVQIEALEIEQVLHKAKSLSVWDILLRAGIAMANRRVAEAAQLAQQAHELGAAKSAGSCIAVQCHGAGQHYG